MHITQRTDIMQLFSCGLVGVTGIRTCDIYLPNEW